MTVRILTGDCRDVLATLDAGSVQTCVTSPPYFGLRDYGVAGQIGLERRRTRSWPSWWRCSARCGACCATTARSGSTSGDSYAARGVAATQGSDTLASTMTSGQGSHGRARRSELKPKDLLGIPWRVAFALQADGWYLRSDIIWHKPNPMPESVTDRPTKAHEYLFLLTKSRSGTTTTPTRSRAAGSRSTA
jgi:hypothetical protein